MSQCLYCQHETTPAQADCSQCGMPLPTQTEQLKERQLKRFKWFCIGLTIFCAVMIVWLPRSMP